MNETNNNACVCNPCSGPSCQCGCQSATTSAVCACGPQCRCGSNCQCAPRATAG